MTDPYLRQLDGGNSPFGADPFNLSMPSSRLASFNNGPLTANQLLPGGGYTPPLSDIGKNVGKFNLTLGFPAPWVPPSTTPEAPQPLTLEPKGNGFFEELGRLPVGIVGPFLDQVAPHTNPDGSIGGIGVDFHNLLNDVFGGLGRALDTPFQAARPLSFLPGGQDINQAFTQMPETPEKQRYEQQMALVPLTDPVSRERWAAQYLRSVEKDYASGSGRNRLLSFIDFPSESLGEQMWRVFFGGLSIQGLATSRLIVGSPWRDVMGQVVNSPNPESLPGPLQQLRQGYFDRIAGGETQDKSYNELLDDISSSQYAFSQDPGLMGTMANFMGQIFTDPLTYETFGLGKLASMGTRGAVSTHANRIVSALYNTDKAGWEGLVKQAGGDSSPETISNLMRTTHPDIWNAEDAKTTGRERTLMALQPVFEGANRVMMASQAPLNWWGPAVGKAIDPISHLFNQRMATPVLQGTVRALGAPEMLKISNFAGKFGALDKLARDLGIVSTNNANSVLQRSTIDRVKAPGAPELTGDPNLIINGQRQVGVSAQMAEENARFTKRRTILAGRVGKAAIEGGLERQRGMASKMMEDMTGASPEEAHSFVAKASEKLLQAIHYLRYGHAIDGFKQAKDEALRLAKQAVEDAPDEKSRLAALDDLEFIQRLTLLSDHVLTVDRAEVLRAAAGNGGPGDMALLRDALDTYEMLAHNFRGKRLSDDVLRAKMAEVLDGLLSPGKGKKLPQRIEADSLRPGALQDFFKNEAARYEEFAYSAGLAPEDVWSYVHDKEGRVVAAHPWIDVVNDGADNTWLPNKIDRLIMGSLTRVQGSRLVMEAREDFIRLGVEKGFTQGEATSLFSAMRDTASELQVGPRGLNFGQIWNAVENIDINPRLRAELGPRGIAQLIAKAWEGDIRAVGITTKISGMAKAKFAVRGNYIGQMAEHFYPYARFYLSPAFIMQEYVEPFFFNIMRGVKPGWRGGTDRDRRLLMLLDFINPHEAFNDMYEYNYLKRIETGESRRLFGKNTRINYITDKMKSAGLADVKRLNYARQWAHEGGKEFLAAIEAEKPGMTNILRTEFGTSDPVELMLRYYQQRGFGMTEEKRHEVFIHDISRPYDGVTPPRLNDVARHLSYQDASSLRDAVRLREFSEDRFVAGLKELGANDDYIAAAWQSANKPTISDWNVLMRHELMQVPTMTKRQAKIQTDTFINEMSEAARALGQEPEDYLAHNFTAVPTKYVTSEALIPTGSLLQMTKRNLEARGIKVNGKNARARTVSKRANTLKPLITDPTKLKKLGNAAARVGEWSDYDNIKRRPVKGLPADLPRGWSRNKVIRVAGAGGNEHIIGPELSALYEGSNQFFGGRGERPINEVANWSTETRGVIIGLADALDDATVQTWLDGLRKAQGDMAGLLENPRDELAARMLVGFGTSNIGASPQMALDAVQRMLDQVTRGERSGWVTKDKGAGESKAKLKVLFQIINPVLDDRNIGLKLSDFIDQLVGNKKRTVTGGEDGLQPAAVDRHVARDFGYFDKAFINGVAKRRVTPLRTFKQARRDVLADYGMTSKDYAALPKEVNVTEARYEWMLRRINDEKDWFNANTIEGRTNWTAEQVQSLHWAHAQSLMGNAPEDLLDRSTTVVAVPVKADPAGLLDEMTGHSLQRAEQKVPGVQVGTAAALPADLKPPTFRDPNVEMVGHDTLMSALPTLAQESGVTILRVIEGQDMGRGGMDPVAGIVVQGPDNNIQDMMSGVGLKFEADEVFATDHNFTGIYASQRVETPTVSSVAGGAHWAMDFSPRRAGDMDRETYRGLARYVHDKAGIDLHVLVPGLDPDGKTMVRGLWLDDGADLATFEAKVPVFEALAEELRTGRWAKGFVGDKRIPVVFERRMVRVQRKTNTIPEGVQDIRLRDQALAVNPVELNVITERLKAMMSGGEDPITGLKHASGFRDMTGMTARVQRKEALPGVKPPGTDAGRLFTSAAKRALANGIDLYGTPNEIVVVRKPEHGSIVIRDEMGEDFALAIDVDFFPNGTVKLGHTVGLNPMLPAYQGIGGKLYDELNERPDLKFYQMVGASGNFSLVGGGYAYNWLQRRYDTLLAKAQNFNSWHYQRAQTEDAWRTAYERGANSPQPGSGNVKQSIPEDDPNGVLFSTPDTEAEVSANGELLRVDGTPVGLPGQRGRLSMPDLNPVAAEAARSSTHAVVAEDRVGFYAQHGFVPVARLGERTYLVRDPAGRGNIPQKVPLVKTEAEARDLQRTYARQVGDLHGHLAEELGRGYYDDLRSRDRGASADRYRDIHRPAAYAALDASLQRNVPNQYSVSLAQRHGAARWVARGGRDSADSPYRFQRAGDQSIRGATHWTADNNAAIYFLKNYDFDTAIHESFHVFARNLTPSAKLSLSEAYMEFFNQKKNKAGTRAGMKTMKTAQWDRDAEEWAAQQFEVWAARPDEMTNGTLMGILNSYAKWGKKVLKVDKLKPTDPRVSEAFNSVFERPKSNVSWHFDPDEERVWEAARQALLRMEDEAHKTHYYARGRSWLERSINHPYLGLYPFSYMWGKVIPEMMRFLVKKPFGMNAPLGGLALAKDVWWQVQFQLQTDSDLRDFIKKHPQLIMFLGLMVPGTPWETPVNVPVVYRRALQNQQQNQERIARGEQPLPFNYLQASKDMVDYAMGIGNFAGRIDAILGEFGNAPEATPAAAAPGAGLTPFQQQALGAVTGGSTVPPLTGP